MVVFLAPCGFARWLLALAYSSLPSLSLCHEVGHHQNHRHVTLASVYFFSSFCGFRASSWDWVKATWLLVVEAIAARVMLGDGLEERASPVAALVHL